MEESGLGFLDTIKMARELERRLLGYAPYSGEIEVERSLDLEPKDYAEMNYEDLINIYERTQKIRNTATMGIFAAATSDQQLQMPEAAPKAGEISRKEIQEEEEFEIEDEEATKKPAKEPSRKEEPPPLGVDVDEIENALREMTTETLKTAEEVGKKPVKLILPEGTGEVVEKEEKTTKTIEFEGEEFGIEGVGKTLPASEEEAAPKKKPEFLEIEKPKPEHEEKEIPEMDLSSSEAKPEILETKRTLKVTVPPALMENPDKTAEIRYAQMETHIKAAVGEGSNPIEIKKKMLELTKQLFKEKMTSKREEIKAQITVLKNMLVSGETGTAKAKRTSTEIGTHLKLYETITTTQESELSHTKDEVADAYKKQVADKVSKFRSSLAGNEDPEKKRSIYEAFVFSITTMNEQLPHILDRYQDFNEKKHTSELQKLKDSLEGNEADTMKKVNTRMSEIHQQYSSEFDVVKVILEKESELVMDILGAEILGTGDEGEGTAAKGKGSVKTNETLKEIIETNEANLLSYLQAKSPKDYDRYEKKEISRVEAAYKAKELLAKERGLPEQVLRKYFSQKGT